VPFGLAFALLWWRPPFFGNIALAIYYAGAYVLFDTVASFCYVPYFALTPEMTSDYDERTSLTSYRMFFSIFASLIAFVVPLLIIGSFRPENSRKVFLTALAFGATSALPLFAVFLISRENKKHVESEPPRLVPSLRALVKNPPFLLGLGIYLFTWVSVDLMQTILLYFLKYCLNREHHSDLVMGTVFAAAILALPLWNWLARRWNKRTTYIVGVAFWAAVQLAIISLGPSTPLPLLLALCFLAGVGLGAAHVLPWSILPDAIEWDEWKTGERHEGLFYSAVTLSQKVASSVAIPLALLLLSISGYRPNAAAQSPTALRVIRLITGPIPAVLLGLGILCAILYPLNRRLYARIVAELESRRAAKLDTKV
jgi:GPH family glycoside/pentoside/hexuronide:cation symporter